MGGRGSGNWYRWDKKTTVEESLVVSIQLFRTLLYSGASGAITWTWGSESKTSIGYYVTWDETSAPIVTLHYRWDGREDVRIPIRLQSTKLQFGGQRWWFTCPLTLDRVPCRRRVGKLYAPPGAKLFGCRKCYNLTYESSQSSHRAERLFGRLGYGPEVTRKMVDRLKRNE